MYLTDYRRSNGHCCLHTCLAVAPYSDLLQWYLSQKVHRSERLHTPHCCWRSREAPQLCTDALEMSSGERKIWHCKDLCWQPGDPCYLQTLLCCPLYLLLTHVNIGQDCMELEVCRDQSFQVQRQCLDTSHNQGLTQVVKHHSPVDCSWWCHTPHSFVVVSMM